MAIEDLTFDPEFEPLFQPEEDPLPVEVERIVASGELIKNLSELQNQLQHSTGLGEHTNDNIRRRRDENVKSVHRKRSTYLRI